MIKLIMESNGGVVIKSVNSDGVWYFVKSATKNKTFWSRSISNVNEFAKKESALNKLYTVLRRLPENAFYDDEDDLLYGIEDADELKNAKFAKFYIVDTNGKEIEDVSAEVREHLLSDDGFISGLMDDLDESVSNNLNENFYEIIYTNEDGGKERESFSGDEYDLRDYVDELKAMGCYRITTNLIYGESVSRKRVTEANAKMKEVKVLQGYYGHGWDDLEEVDADDIQGVKELRDDLKAYDENERQYAHRIITRKVPNPDYDPSKARKSRAKGFAIVINNDQPMWTGKEVWYTEDPNITADFMVKNGYVNNSLSGMPAYIYDDGYKFIQKNFTKLEPDEYEQKKYYSYYTVFLADGQRVESVMYANY